MATTSPDRSQLKFTDLVRAREVQQERERLALISQNIDLRRQLELGGSEAPTSPTPATKRPLSPSSQRAQTARSETHSTAAPTSHEGETRSTASRPARTNADSGDVRSGSGGAGPLVTSSLDGMWRRIEEMVDNAVSPLRESHAQFRENVELRLTTMQAALTELQQGAATEERTRSILRDEQAAQQLTLCQELEALRRDLDDHDRRIAARDDEISCATASVQGVVAQQGDFDERLVACEALPRSVRADVDSMEERFHAFTATVTADRAALAAMRNEVLEQHEGEMRDAIADAREHLARLVSAAADCEKQAATAQERADDSVKENIAHVAEQLDQEMAARLEEQSERILEMQQRQAAAQQETKTDITHAIATMQGEMQQSIDDLKAAYVARTEEQLTDVVRRAEEFEEQRRLACPMADPDRIELMAKELEGAYHMLDGIARNNAGALMGDAKLSTRVSDMEAKLAGLEAVVGGDGAEAARQVDLRFNIGVQVAAADIPAFSQEARMEQNFAEELRRAEDGASIADAQRVLGDRFSKSPALLPPAPAAPAAPALPPSETPLALLARGDASPVAAEYGAPLFDAAAAPPLGAPAVAATQFTTPVQPPQPSQHRSASFGVEKPRFASPSQPGRSESVDELRGRRAEKEAALSKLQAVLQNIQDKFQVLSQKEARRSASSTTPSGEAGRRVAEQIAAQKQAVYQHERQLVEQRNRLWQEIGELHDQEAAAEEAELML